MADTPSITARPDAAQAGRIRIGSLLVNRLGFGAARITGREMWGPPHDPAEAVRTLRRLPELGVDFIDTANSYGPDVSEQLIREALHPYKDIIIATKGGLVRISAEDRWLDGRPEHLISEARRSRDKLDVESIDLWQLHRIDGEVPQDEQFGAIRALLDEKVIRNAGLCEVSVPQIKAAQAVFPIASVQNRYNLQERRSDPVLDYCADTGIAFIAWHPLRAGVLARVDSPLSAFARNRRMTPAQVALAFLLKRSPALMAIPGTAKVSHLEENVAAAGLQLSDAEFSELSTI